MNKKDIEATVDIMVTDHQEVLLVQRKNEPFKGKWALPGGFMEHDEKVIQAAQRELKEETALQLPKDDFEFVGYFDKPNRDPRGRVISFAFKILIDKTEKERIKAGDDARLAQWFPLNKLPELAFDHASILATGLAK